MATVVWWFWGGYERGRIEALSHTSFFLAVLTVAFALLWWWTKAGEAKLPPGPRGLPLVGNLPFLRPDLHRYLAELARTYGPVMRLRLGAKLCVVLSSPDAAKEALKDNDAIFGDHDVPAVALDLYAGKSMLWASGARWRMIRRLSVREVLSHTTVEGLYSLRRQEVRRMVQEVRGKAGEPVEVRELAFVTTLNVITTMLWGATVPEYREEKEATLRKLRQAVDTVGELMGVPNVSDFFPALAWLDLQGIGRRMRKAEALIDRILDSIIDQRVRTMGSRGEGDGVASREPRDFLQVLMEILRKGDPQVSLTIEDVKALLLDIIAAGTDTTSSTVEWAMAELLANPDKMTRAKGEIAMVVGGDRVVEESHLPKLPYLDAVIKEVLRLHPAAPLLVPHCPSSSSTIAGHKIPKGTRVFINAWAMQRDPQFWEDASRFEPERFLGVTGKLEYNGNSFFYLPFGAGRRICAGMTLGERVVKYMVASLLYSADWSLPDGAQMDLEDRFGMVMKKERALVAVPTLS